MPDLQGGKEERVNTIMKLEEAVREVRGLDQKAMEEAKKGEDSQ